jgi:hypothetical protein
MVLIEKREWAAWGPEVGLPMVVTAIVDTAEEQAWLLKEA